MENSIKPKNNLEHNPTGWAHEIQPWWYKGEFNCRQCGLKVIPENKEQEALKLLSGIAQIIKGDY